MNNQSLLLAGVIMKTAAFFIIVVDVLPKQIKEIRIADGKLGKIPIILFFYVAVVAMTSLILTLIQSCNFLESCPDLPVSYSSIVNSTGILAMAIFGKVLYSQYRRHKK